MKRSTLLLTVLASTLCISAAVASLYMWNDTKRPPLSLRDALTRAEKLLGDDAANRYCVSVSLNGDETGDGKEGAWNFWFAATDGSKKQVYIDMDGKSEVKLWNGPIDEQAKEDRLVGLDELRRRLERLFAKEKIAAEISIRDGRLLVTYHVRDYQIYDERNDGEYAEKLNTTTGPKADGVWLSARVVDRPDRREEFYDDRGPYWRRMCGTYYLTQNGKFLAVEFRFGSNISSKLANQIERLCGDRTRDN